MTPYDSEYETSADSEVGEAAEGAARLVERYHLVLKVAVFYAVAFGLGLLAFHMVDGPNAQAIVAIGLWFTVIFAVLTALLGIGVKLLEAVARHRRGYA